MFLFALPYFCHGVSFIPYREKPGTCWNAGVHVRSAFNVKQCCIIEQHHKYTHNNWRGGINAIAKVLEFFKRYLQFIHSHQGYLFWAFFPCCKCWAVWKYAIAKDKHPGVVVDGVEYLWYLLCEVIRIIESISSERERKKVWVITKHTTFCRHFCGD